MAVTPSPGRTSPNNLRLLSSQDDPVFSTSAAFVIVFLVLQKDSHYESLKKGERAWQKN
jgi:hypothetical protein